MKTPAGKWIVRASAVAVFLFLAVYCLRDFWFGQIRIYVLGLMEVRAEETGLHLPEADEVEVIALGGTGPEQAAEYPVAGRTTLRGADAETTARLWRSLRRGRQFSALCHDPVYALRFRQHGKLLLETTVCWKCHNYTIPVSIFGHVISRFEYGFDSDRADAQALSRLLDEHVPLSGRPSA